MSDHLPPLADLLPHLHAGDHITAEFSDGALIVTGELQSLGENLYLGRNGSGFTVRNRTYPGMYLTAITSAPDAHQRWAEAQQPTWADGTPADDDTVFVVAAENDYGQQRRYGRGADGWIALDGWEEGPDHIATAALIARGARPVARYITAEADPASHDYTSTACHHQDHDRCRKTCKFCNAVCGCTCHADQPTPELACRCGHSLDDHRTPGGECIECMDTPNDCGHYKPPATLEPATCDRDHEPPIGSTVHTTSGAPFERRTDGWYGTAPVTAAFNWATLLAIFGDMTLVEEGTSAGAEQHDISAAQLAWFDYRKDYQPNPKYLTREHVAFIAGYEAAQAGVPQDGPLT